MSELKPKTKDIINDLMYIAKFPENCNAPYICRIAAERLAKLENDLLEAESVIEQCEEAFYDRCHDDYAEAAIEAWNNRRVGEGEKG